MPLLYYEDVMQTTEAAYTSVTAAKEGRVQEAAPKNIKKGKMGIGKGFGANTFYYKHLIENRRGKILLLPTLTIVVTDTKNINKITTVGCFNISGVMICLNNLFNQITAVSKFSITDNIFNIIIMLSGAAVGVVLYYILPDIFVYIFKNSAQHRLKLINAKLEKLKSNWDNLIPEQR